MAGVDMDGGSALVIFLVAYGGMMIAFLVTTRVPREAEHRHRGRTAARLRSGDSARRAPPRLGHGHLPAGRATAAADLPRFGDVTGMRDVKRQLASACRAVLQPGAPRTATRILMHGPRGAGKSFVVAAAAGQHRLPLVSLSAADLVRRRPGESRRIIQALVRRAVDVAPCVVLLCDVHTTGGRRASPAARAATNDVLRVLGALDIRRRVVIVVTTTTLAGLDETVRSASVFDAVVEVPVPDEHERMALIDRYMATQGLWLDGGQRIVAQRTLGFTPRDLWHLCHRAGARAVSDAPTTCEVRVTHLLAALDERAGPRRIEELTLDESTEQMVTTLTAMLADPYAGPRLLLIGRRGVGKTTVARCIAASANRHVVRVACRGADATDDGTLVLDHAVREACARTPSMLLLDDVDAAPRMLSNVDGGAEAAPGPLQRALRTRGVAIVVTATARGVLPRFAARTTRTVALAAPGFLARRSLLRQHLLGAALVGTTLDDIADQTDGASPRELRAIAVRALSNAERRARRRNVPGSGGALALTSVDVDGALCAGDQMAA